METCEVAPLTRHCAGWEGGFLGVSQPTQSSSLPGRLRRLAQRLPSTAPFACPCCGAAPGRSSGRTCTSRAACECTFVCTPVVPHVFVHMFVCRSSAPCCASRCMHGSLASSACLTCLLLQVLGTDRQAHEHQFCIADAPRSTVLTPDPPCLLPAAARGPSARCTKQCGTRRKWCAVPAGWGRLLRSVHDCHALASVPLFTAALVETLTDWERLGVLCLWRTKSSTVHCAPTSTPALQAVKVVGELQRAQEAAGPEAQQLRSPILQNLRLVRGCCCGLQLCMACCTGLQSGLACPSCTASVPVPKLHC